MSYQIIIKKNKIMGTAKCIAHFSNHDLAASMNFKYT